jgi:DNA-binding transcriptional MerR regulator
MSSKTYSSSQVAQIFTVSNETVRQWAITFKHHLSIKSQTANGLKRNFTTDDLTVFALIHDMKAEGKLFADIEAALSNNQRGAIPTTDTLAPPERGKLAALQAEVELYKAALTDTKNNENKLAGQVELLERQLTAALGEIARLNRELGKLG